MESNVLLIRIRIKCTDRRLKGNHRSLSGFTWRDLNVGNHGVGFLHFASDTPSMCLPASLFLVPWWLPEFLSTELQWSCQTKGRGEKQRVYSSVLLVQGRHCSHPCRHIDYKTKLAFSPQGEEPAVPSATLLEYGSGWQRSQPGSIFWKLSVLNGVVSLTARRDYTSLVQTSDLPSRGLEQLLTPDGVCRKEGSA